MTERGAQWPKSLKMAKNRENSLFYAKKNQLFDFFKGKLGGKCVCFQNSRVSENFGHFWICGIHFEIVFCCRWGCDNVIHLSNEPCPKELSEM